MIAGMFRRLRLPAIAASTLLLGAAAFQGAQAAPLAIGYISYDVTSATTAEFDIGNITGANAQALGDPNFVVYGTTVSFSGLTLTVDFSDGTSQVFDSTYFTLDADGESLDGTSIAIGGSVLPVSVSLTGNIDQTSLTLADSSVVTVDAAFTDGSGDPSGVGFASSAGSGPLTGIESAVIYANPSAGGGGTVPEPGSLPLVLGAMATLWATTRRRVLRARAATSAASGSSKIAKWFTVALCLPAAGMAATVGLTTATLPGTGVTGITSVNLTSTGLPATTTPAEVNIAVAPTCAAGASGPVAGEVDTTAKAIATVIGSTKKIQFQIPAGLSQGTYFVSVSGTATNGTPFASSTCSIVVVTASNATLNACLPTSSLAVATGTNVTAYVPNGWWGSSSTGVRAVTIEGVGAPVAISTPNSVNSCSSNPATGQTVCTANNTDVYLISGTALNKTLTSSATGGASFSGGTCLNCGVAINALTNTAYIEVGLTGSPSGSGIQTLSLAGTPTLGVPFPMAVETSENISVDPGRNLLLSPNEDSFYALLQLNAAGTITGEYDLDMSPVTGYAGEPDSAAEDCTTGIALSSLEFSDYIYLADLSQATLTAGTPGSWTAPSAIAYVGPGFSAGTSGISVAPGGSHLGITTGEFGGQSFTVFQLPAASGTGGAVPGLVDFAYVASLPNTPDGFFFSAGYDPHTITAYTSPNDGRSYGVIADWATGLPAWLVVIDLQKVLAAPRSSANIVDPSYDLVANGVIRYVATQ